MAGVKKIKHFYKRQWSFEKKWPWEGQSQEKKKPNTNCMHLNCQNSWPKNFLGPALSMHEVRWKWRYFIAVIILLSVRRDSILLLSFSGFRGKSCPNCRHLFLLPHPHYHRHWQQPCKGNSLGPALLLSRCTAEAPLSQSCSSLNVVKLGTTWYYRGHVRVLTRSLWVWPSSAAVKVSQQSFFTALQQL